jgi:hypothetical protein
MNSYTCSPTKSNKEDGIFHELSSYLINLSIGAKSLIRDLDSNPAEQLNSLVAKYVGGKRINYSLGDSYAMRCSMAVAVVQYNNKYVKLLFETAYF